MLKCIVKNTPAARPREVYVWELLMHDELSGCCNVFTSGPSSPALFTGPLHWLRLNGLHCLSVHARNHVFLPRHQKTMNGGSLLSSLQMDIFYHNEKQPFCSLSSVVFMTQHVCREKALH